MKISLDRQLANLLVQLADPLPTVSRECVAAKDRRRVLQQLRLPARHLVRMHLVMRRNLGHCLLTPDRFQRHPRLECRRVVTSWLLHGLRSSVQARARSEITLYPCPKNRSQLCSSRSRIERSLNALLRCFGRELMKTVRAPPATAARSCEVRPALSNSTSVGLNSRSNAATSRARKVGEDGRN